MRPPKPLPLLLLGSILLSVGMAVAAQTANPNPPVRGDFPAATPAAANVIVIPPPTPSDPIGQILADPRIYTPIPPPLAAPYVPPGFIQPGQTVIVIGELVNLRSEPRSGVGVVILARLNRGDDLTVLALSDDLLWAQVDTLGPLFLQGWISTSLIQVQSEFQAFAPGLPNQGGSGYSVKADNTVNVRYAPTIFSDRVGILAEGALAEIIGRTSTYSWWKIRLNDGVVGWVSSTYVFPTDQAAFRSVPILTE